MKMRDPVCWVREPTHLQALLPLEPLVGPAVLHALSQWLSHVLKMAWHDGYQAGLQHAADVVHKS